MADVPSTTGQQPIPNEVGRILSQLLVNLHRTEYLVNLYETLEREKGNDPARVDILRAAIVLIHASIEEFFRGCTLILLPNRPAEHLSGIPLAGNDHDLARRSEKFTLGNLLAHRGKPVEQVIEESISEYLQKTTYNSASDIAAAMTRCGLKLEKIQSHLPAFESIMKRRHEIVHQSDMKHGRPGEFILKGLSAGEIKGCIVLVKKVLSKLFFEEVATKFAPKAK